MKNTEIRIGNLIKRNGLVVTVDEQTFWDIKYKPEEFEPIPLKGSDFDRFLDFEKSEFPDEEEFVEYHNKKNAVDAPYFVIGVCNNEIYGIWFGYMQQFDKEHFNNIIIFDEDDGIYSIHEFQNIYYALYGEELKMN